MKDSDKKEWINVMITNGSRLKWMPAFMLKNSRELLKRESELISNDEFWSKVENISSVSNFLTAMMFDSSEVMRVASEFYKELSYVMTVMGIGPDFSVPDYDDIFEDQTSVDEESKEPEKSTKYRSAI